MHALCDAIDLKHFVKGSLKVSGKSLKRVLDEVHFLVNLYSFPLPPAPQAKLSIPKLVFPPPKQNNF